MSRPNERGGTAESFTSMDPDADFKYK